MRKDELVSYESEIINEEVKELIEEIIENRYINVYEGETGDDVSEALRAYLVEFVELIADEEKQSEDDASILPDETGGYDCLACFLEDSTDAFVAGWIISASHPSFGVN